MNGQYYLKKLQQEELDILLVISNFCKRNDIEWFLMSGTALGALRHEGFIPWDDDIDIGMLRDQYDRFVELSANGLPEGYSLHTHRNTKGFAGFFAKVYRDGTVFQTAETVEAGCKQAIYIDIFPLDRVPNDVKATRTLLRKASVWQRMSYLYHSRVINVPHHGTLGTLERIACRCAHHLIRGLFSPKAIADRFEALADRSSPSKDESERYVALSWPYVEPIDRAILCPPSAALFEGHRLPVPAKAEEYLTIWYGDWKQLPPPEKRHTHLPERIVFSDGDEWLSPDA